jgi:ABC-type branched-subunit amino acid transport system ATPase component
MPETALLRTERLTRAFGSLIAVDRADVVTSGEMVPSAGRIWIGERDITGLPQHAVARLGIAKSYQITNVFPHLRCDPTTQQRFLEV